MSSDTTPYHFDLIWVHLYGELKGTPWEDSDLDVHRFWHNEPSEHAPAVDALKYVHTLLGDRSMVDAEDAVLATLRAAREHHATMLLTPDDVMEMARQLSVFYDSFEQPMDDYLDEYCGEVRWHWLNDHGRKEIEKAVIKDSEIWINDPDLGGVWVFNKPGH